MNKNHQHFQPDELEDLLLQTLINDFNNNIEIQKTIEMNMNYIQSLPIENAVSLSFDKKYKDAFKVNYLGNVFWSKILLIGLSLALINSVFNTPNNLQSSDAKSSSLIFVKDSTDNILVENKESLKIINQNEAILINDSISTIIHKNDSSKESFPNNWGVHSAEYQSKSSFKTEIFDEEFALAILSNSHDVKLEPSYYGLNGYKTIIYKPKSSNYSKVLDSTGKPANKPEYQILPLYEGIPFKKLFENFTFISHTPQLEKPSIKLNDIAIERRLPQTINLYFDDQSPDFNPQALMKNDENLKFIAPFYISNYEISNIDYREFLVWVAKYNGLDNIKFTTDSLDYFKRYLNYTFHSENQEITKRFGTNTVNVMPKTDVWETDFSNSYNQPLTTHYLAHPAYRTYPVVGVTYWQALAYLDWLTWIWQSRIDAQGIPYEIKYDLPTAYEWERSCDYTLNQHAMDFPIFNGICNLAVERIADLDYRRALGLMHSNHFEQVMESFYTAPVMSPTPSNPALKEGIVNMAGNVSEWLKEDYQGNWSGYYSRKTAELAQSEQPASKIFLATMSYFDQTCNHPKGKMVMGSNWYDRRWTDRAITLANGMSAKAFINPDEAHSTVGFRPVIRVKLKNEDKLLQIIRTLGRVLPVIDYGSLKINKNEMLQSFAFVPMGSFKSKGKTISVQAFYTMKTEVTNLEWMLFLNDLLKSGEMEKLQECIPAAVDWSLKMTYESGMYKDWKLADRWEYLPFPKKFVSDNKLKDMPLTSFAFEPIVGISHKAMQYYAQWMSQKSGIEIDFRLPMELEYEWMSLGGLSSDSVIYPWQGKFMRDYRGVFLARYHSHMSDFGKGAKPNLPLDSTFFNQRKTLHATDSNWTNPNGPFIIATFKPNGFGIYDLAGNAAEAVYETGFTKGGSWGSTSAFLQIKQREYWSGQSSDCVGFRLVMTYLGKKE
jgi:formylglycine-generating enzyme required for sulfatase activity